MEEGDAAGAEKERETLADFPQKDHLSPKNGTTELEIGEESTPGTAENVGTTTTAEQPGRIYSVILFGRTGSGKSTLAQMLTLGRLDPDSKKFASSSGIRGQTKEVKHGQGREWSVLDTPGFGEPKHQLSTISSDEAEKKIKKYLQLIEGTYTHFLYLVMRDRIDELDKRLWTFFIRLCGDSIKTNFSVVISNASRPWLDQNLENLKTSFKGCEHFLTAEFPSTKTDDQEWEAELQSIRMESLKELEDALKKLDRTPVKCDFDDGFWKMTKQIVLRFMKNVTTAVMSRLQFSCLTNLLKRDGEYILPDIDPTDSPTKPSGSNK